MLGHWTVAEDSHFQLGSAKRIVARGVLNMGTGRLRAEVWRVRAAEPIVGVGVNVIHATASSCRDSAALTQWRRHRHSHRTAAADEAATARIATEIFGVHDQPLVGDRQRRLVDCVVGVSYGENGACDESGSGILAVGVSAHRENDWRCPHIGKAAAAAAATARCATPAVNFVSGGRGARRTDDDDKASAAESAHGGERNKTQNGENGQRTSETADDD